MPPTIRTARLTLRKPRPEDLDALAPIFADPQVTRFLGDGRPRSRDRVLRGLENALACWDRFNFGPFVVIHQAEIIGDCLLYPIARSGTDPAQLDARGPEIEIGYRLARAAWGKGLATEAARAVLEWSTRDPDGPRLDRLVAVTYPENTASQRVVEKLGLRPVGLTRDYYDTQTLLFETGPKQSEGRQSVPRGAELQP